RNNSEPSTSYRRTPVSILAFIAPAKLSTGIGAKPHPPNLDSGFRRNDRRVTGGAQARQSKKIRRRQKTFKHGNSTPPSFVLSYFFSFPTKVSSTSFITGFIASRWLSVSKYLTPSIRRLLGNTSSLGISVLRESGLPSSACASAL